MLTRQQLKRKHNLKAYDNNFFVSHSVVAIVVIVAVHLQPREQREYEEVEEVEEEEEHLGPPLKQPHLHAHPHPQSQSQIFFGGPTWFAAPIVGGFAKL